MQKKHKKELIYANPHECFWIHNGPVVNSLLALADAVEYDLSDDMFAYHSTVERNDFADWIENVLNDTKTAALVRKARTRGGLVRKLRASLKEYAV